MTHYQNYDADVIIVGAGPVGLALAKGLARQGKKIIVLEKNESLSVHSKALSIWPPTQQILADLGVLPSFEHHSFIFDRISMHDADQHDAVIATIPLFRLQHITPYPRVLILPQSQTETLLYQSLQEEPSVRVIFSSEVTHVKDDGTHVTLSYLQQGKKQSATARFVAGCDGAHSVVRGQLGISLEGQTFPYHAALADIRITDGSDSLTPRITTDPNACVAIKISQDHWRLIILLGEQNDESDQALKARIHQLSGHLFKHSQYEITWQSRFSLHRRAAEEFCKGNIVLAGDAAHLNSPVGGQGMNAGIQDSAILVKALVASLDANDNAALHDYARLRKQIIQTQVNKNTGAATKLLFKKNGKYIKWIMRGFGLLLKIPVLRERILKGVAMISS